jgi:flagellar motor protein MotB
MRKFIFILSFIFYLCAAIITFMAMNISPPGTVSTQEALSTDQSTIEPTAKEPEDREFEDIQPEDKEFADNEPADKEPEDKEEISTSFTEEQADDKAVVKELKSTIANLEERLAKAKEEGALNNTVTQPEQTETVIATVGGGLFSSGQDMMSNELRTVVKDIVTKLMAFPDHHIRVEGHTDNLPVSSISSKRYHDNYELSFLRAKAVAFLLEEYGVSKERISIIGFGDTRPIAPNTTKEGRAQNRRVEVRVIPPSI